MRAFVSNLGARGRAALNDLENMMTVTRIDDARHEC